MATTIFYSWQSDIDSSINRNFIENALEKAVKALAQDLEIQEALRDEIAIDKDTKGVPGTPPIVDTIFSKISNCWVFVPDLTFVGKVKEGRYVSNPNVLIEYGWALKEVSHARMVPIMNTVFGEPEGENLPFDMRHLRRPITYSLEEGASPEARKKVKEELVNDLSEAIGLIIKNYSVVQEVHEEYKGVTSTTKESIFFKETDKLLEPGKHLINNHELKFPDNQHLFLRLIPSNPLNKMSTKDLLKLVQGAQLPPMSEAGYYSWGTGRNKFGCYVAMLDRDTKEIISITQVFKNGEIWGIDAHGIDKNRLMEWGEVEFGFFPSVFFENVYKHTLSHYLTFSKKFLNTKPTFKFIVGATGVEGYRMTIDRGYSGLVVEDNIIYEGEINDYEIEPVKILRPFFDYVWNECGLDRPDVDSLG